MKKVVTLVVVLAVLGAAGFGGFWWWKSRDKGATAALATSSNVGVMRGPISQAVPTTGRVVSNLDVDIKCRASGQVIKLPFDISQSVKQGDLLLQLDPADQQRSVSLSEVSFSIAQAKLAQARQNLVVAEQAVTTSKDRADAMLRSAEIRAKDSLARADRRRQLIEQKLGSQEDYDTAQSDAASAAADLDTAKVAVAEAKTQELALEVKREDVKLAEAQIASDQISLDNARQQLAYTTVTAPLDGVVAAQGIQIGTIISSGITNVGGGTTIMTISDLSRVFVLATVDESDIGKVALGQSVDITVDAYPNRKFSGSVMRIATKGVNVSNVVTFEVKIEVLDEKKTMLKPEMTANVLIVSARKDDAIMVPAAALTRNKGKFSVMVVGADGVAQERAVKIGLTDGERTEIIEGLGEGDTVQVKVGEAQSRWNGNQPRPGVPGMGGPIPGGMGGGGRGGR